MSRRLIIPFLVVCGVAATGPVPARSGDLDRAGRAPDLILPGGKEIHLLAAEESAVAILQDAPSPFFDRVTTLDMSVRMGIRLDGNDDAANRRRFKAFVVESVRDWSPGERAALLEALQRAHGLCDAVVPLLVPRQWRFIKTTGREEGGAPYTRGNSIVLPQGQLVGLPANGPSASFVEMIIHETFHVYSRMHPQQRERLYKCLGFSRTGPVKLGEYLSQRRITNPDGVDYGYRITIRDARNEPMEAILLTYSSHRASPKPAMGLFAHVTFSLFELRERNGVWEVVLGANGLPQPISPQSAGEFGGQIGGLTGFPSHPDEILADHVALEVSRASPSDHPGAPPGDLGKLRSQITRILNSE